MYRFPNLIYYLFLLNSFNLIVTVYEKPEKHTSFKEVKRLNHTV